MAREVCVDEVGVGRKGTCEMIATDDKAERLIFTLPLIQTQNYTDVNKK